MRSHYKWVWLIAIVLLGFGLRLLLLDAVALRGDEAFSVQYWAGQSLSITLSDIATIEPHPPLTYALFRFWGLFVGLDNPVALRLLPVFSNILGVAAMYILGRRLLSPQAGLIAAFLWAIHPFEIWHAQDFRNYALWASLSAITLYAGLRVLDEKSSRIDWLRYIVIGTFSGMIFYFELITIGVLLVYGWVILWQRKRANLVQWTLVNFALIAFIMGVFLVFQGNLVGSGDYGGTTGGFNLPELITRFIPTLAFGSTIPANIMPILGVAVSVGLLICIGWLWRKNAKIALFVGALWVLPMMVLGVASLRLNIFAPRYIMNSIPAYLLALALCSLYLWHSSRKAGSIILLAAWCLISAYGLFNHYTDNQYRKAPDWPALVTYLADNTTSDDVIIQLSVDAGFGYYYTVLKPPAGEFALPETPQQSHAEIIETMEETAPQFESIWITGTTFRDWPSVGVVEAWLDENMQKVRQTTIAGQPIVQYKAWDVSENAQDNIIAEWDSTAQLVGQRIFEPEPMEDLTIWLYWQPLAQTDTPLTAFVHLVGDINPETGSPLWSQDDHPPQNERISTIMWDTETVYRDVFVLPLEGVAAGQYSLYVGFYDPSGNRILTLNGDDAFLLGELNLP